MKQHEPRPVEAVDQPLEIRRVDGEIVVIGPGPVAFSMTLEAARATCRRMTEVLDADPSSGAE